MSHIEQSQRINLSTNSRHKILPIKTTFNLLKICSSPYKIIKKPEIYYDCICECGIITSVRYSSLLAGIDSKNTHAIRSCGCKRIETINNKIKPHHCDRCGETDPKKFGKLNKIKCSRCYSQDAYHNTSNYAYFRRLIAGVRSRAHRKNKKRISCTINAQYLYDLWNKQDGRCAITNISMTLKHKSLFSVSVDRITSIQDYTTNNVQLVCLGVNLAKRNYTDSEVLQLFNAYTKSS